MGEACASTASDVRTMHAECGALRRLRPDAGLGLPGRDGQGPGLAKSGIHCSWRWGPAARRRASGTRDSVSGNSSWLGVVLVSAVPAGAGANLRQAEPQSPPESRAREGTREALPFEPLRRSCEEPRGFLDVDKRSPSLLAELISRRTASRMISVRASLTRGDARAAASSAVRSITREPPVR